MRRMIDTNIWEDATVEELPTMAKLLWVYVLTSPRGNLAGCFELTMRRVSIDTGMDAGQARDAMRELCDAGLVSYSEATSEVLVRNWFKHNWSNSPKLLKPLAEAIHEVKDNAFRAYLADAYEKRAGKEYPYGIDTIPIEDDTVPIGSKAQVKYTADTLSIEHGYSPISISISNTKEEPKGVRGSGEGGADPAVAEAAEEIVAYLNARIGTHYKPKSKGTLKHVSARLREGYTVDDFRTVIDKKCADWRNDPRMAPYLRPETLFGPKFEGYLNEIEIRGGVADGRYDKYR